MRILTLFKRFLELTAQLGKAHDLPNDIGISRATDFIEDPCEYSANEFRSWASGATSKLGYSEDTIELIDRMDTVLEVILSLDKA